MKKENRATAEGKSSINWKQTDFTYDLFHLVCFYLSKFQISKRNMRNQELYRTYTAIIRLIKPLV